MKLRYKIPVVIVTITTLALGLSLYLADYSIGNRDFTKQPQIFEAGTVAQILSPQVISTNTVIVEGRVATIEGEVVAGAMISAVQAGGSYRVTVYSNSKGQYRLSGHLEGQLEMRARAPAFADTSVRVKASPGTNVQLDWTLRKLQSDEERSGALTASGHAQLLKWPDARMRSVFISQCHFCHQIGNEFTRAPRDLSVWSNIVDRMEGYLVMLSESQKMIIRDTLANTFNGEPVVSIQTHTLSPKLADARVEEWQIGNGESFIHDADMGNDGRLYGVDEGHDLLWILDRNTGKVEQVPFPPSDLPVGGLFAGLAMPIGIFTGKHGPHSLAQAEDGRFWITNALSSTLMSYDPSLKRFEIYPLGGDALYPHTIRIDKTGTVWFTLAASNQVARFDPHKRRFTIINLPSNGFFRWLSDAYFPLILKVAALFPRQNLHLSLSHHKWFGLGKEALAMPYGIDVNPVDGSIWYAKLYANRIGRIDPVTLEITEYETPLHGPRRPRFDKKGTLWIPFFEDSTITAFDPAGSKFRSYKLPRLGPNEYETPYALNVHPQTGEIWITSNQSDRVLRFDPETDQFVSYPIPTRVSFLRDLVFSAGGKVCSSQSNLPAYAIEGGVPSFICIDPGHRR
jgi:virginiamycin B lyase